MKKGVCVIMALFFLVGLLSVSAFAYTEENPFVADLIAGQNFDAGDVLVWNDAENLYVKYDLDSDWCLTEYHLHVATSLNEIPQTKKGNPKPGHFEYKEEYDACIVDPVLIEIPLVAAESFDIAAHAVVVHPIDGCYETVWQIGDEEDNACNGNLTNYANEFNWKKEDSPDDFSLPVGDCELGPGLGDNRPVFTDPFLVGTTATNEFPYNSNKRVDYAVDFDVQWEGDLLLGGLLTISWSPGASARETKIVSGDGITETSFTAQGANRAGEGWYMDKYPLVQDTIGVDPLPDQINSIRFRQTNGDGTFWDWIKLEKPCEQWESAWADGTGFPGKNWATYFTYDPQDSDLQ
jgi:hypothetical protein